ncbi:MAG: hypothetical protein RLZZ450_635 [Pseudomonadota bacterium]
MTAFCVSSTSRSRPLTFMIMTAGGAEHIPEPIPPNQSVETSEEDSLEQPLPTDQGLPLGRPGKKQIDEDEHGPG